ncbi:hypothetical protein HF086_005214 [Spodoptera exigua]|uniref:Glucosylceramidase n=1 Tax=Spodoptera exigua TaxID=7107 RepID=A0A922MYM0_SPOEX|nr:hypothetical protein HF086_005214 [Spodoptera exigua]
MARVIVWFFLSIFVQVINSDKPCAARDVGGESVVCVCNASYCDTISRTTPDDDEYIVYTSSRAGSRFKKSFGKFKTSEKVTCPVTFVLELENKHQIIEGFGAAITDSAAINWMSLSSKLRQRFIDTYFSEKGIEYSMLRVPIGGTDFSRHKYAYNELPKNDMFLSNFTLSEEDNKYKIPMIKQAFAAARAPVHIVSTLWAPPSWMVETSNYTTCGRLQLKYFSTLADYHLNNLFAPPEQLTLISRSHPEKFILSTEFCEGTFVVFNYHHHESSLSNVGATPGQVPKVDLGSWTRLQSYISNILTVHWNICLDEQGGPAWNGNFVDSPVIVAPSKGEFYKQPMFYAMGHVSKFIPRGSYRINIRTEKCNTTAVPESFSFVQQEEVIQSAAFLTPYKTVVVVLHNKGPATTIGVQLQAQHASINIEAESIVTVEFNNKS